MRKGLIIGLGIVVVLVAICAIWFLPRSRVSKLSPAELSWKMRAPEPPKRLTEGCPELNTLRALVRGLPDSKTIKASKDSLPLGPDEIEIYQVILEQRALQGWTPLNVSARTHPLDVMSGKELTCACLDGIYLEDSLGAFSSFHELTSQILPIAKMRLVDPDKQAAVVRSNDPDVTIRKGKAVHDAARDAYATGLF